ncbi:MAG: RNA polymerase sigma factor [bacterium]|nr:RNA polymerase sigma factor [bacterium]
MSRTSAAAALMIEPDEVESSGAMVERHADAQDSLIDPNASEAQVAGETQALSELSDQALLEGLRAQSEPHFGELYNRYFQRIYNFVYARMRNHAETEEVVQETFLAVFRSFENYRGQSSLLSWIYGIAKNTTNNHLRRAKSQNERIDLADDEDLVPRASLGEGMPDEQLDMQRFGDLLAERLDGVADWQAEIFEMRHFENLSIPEISERTKRSSDAVRSSLYRVKRLFFEAAAANGIAVAVAGGSRR